MQVKLLKVLAIPFLRIIHCLSKLRFTPWNVCCTPWNVYFTAWDVRFTPWNIISEGILATLHRLLAQTHSPVWHKLDCPSPLRQDLSSDGISTLLPYLSNIFTKQLQIGSERREEVKLSKINSVYFTQIKQNAWKYQVKAAFSSKKQYFCKIV